MSLNPEDTKDRNTGETDTIFDADDESSSEDPPVNTPASDSNVSDSKSEDVQQRLLHAQPSRHELDKRDFTDFIEIPEDPGCPCPLKHLGPCFHSRFRNMAVQSRSAVPRNEALHKRDGKSHESPAITPRPSTQSARSPARSPAIEWEDDTSGRRDSSARSDLAEPASPRPSVQEAETSESPGSAVPPAEAHADEAASSQVTDGSPDLNTLALFEEHPMLLKLLEYAPDPPAEWKISFWTIQLLVLFINITMVSGHNAIDNLCEMSSTSATFFTVLPIIQLCSLFGYCSRNHSLFAAGFVVFLLLVGSLWLEPGAVMQQMCAHVDTSKWVAKDSVDAMGKQAMSDALVLC